MSLWKIGQAGPYPELYGIGTGAAAGLTGQPVRLVYLEWLDMFLLYSTVASAPGMGSFHCWLFDAATGELLTAVPLTGGGLLGPFTGIGINALDGSLQVGTSGRLFKTHSIFLQTTITEISPYDLTNISGGYSCSLWDLPNVDISVAAGIMAGAIVNLIDGYLVLVGHGYAYCWTIDLTATPYTYTWFTMIKLTTSSLSGVAYQDQTYAWIAQDNGYLIKFNYRTMRVVGYAGVLTPGAAGDRKYVPAWDSKRQRLVIFRWKDDDLVNSLSQSLLEVYAPAPQPAILTHPVPTEPLRAPERDVPFICNLVGDSGEPVGSYPIYVNLTPTAKGVVRPGSCLSGIGGSGRFLYDCLAAGEETMNLTAPYTEEAQPTAWP